jgi:hypothetical protein
MIGRRLPASSSFVLAAQRLRALQLDPTCPAARQDSRRGKAHNNSQLKPSDKHASHRARFLRPLHKGGPHGCCTLGPAVRIMSVTCGAKGTRTPDPLLAKPGQSVHGRWPRMGVIERPASYGKVQARWCQSWVSPCPSMRTLSATVDGGRCCCSADRATRRDGDSRLGCRTRCCTDPPARLSAAARVAVLQSPAITV